MVANVTIGYGCDNVEVSKIMADNLICIEADNSLSFGDYTLEAKSKVEDFPYDGNLMKVKTYKDITKLEKNGNFVYESVPGTKVFNFVENADGVEFTVEGTSDEDAQITVGLEEGTEYKIDINGADAGVVKTNLAGKLNFSVDLSNGKVKVIIKK